MKTYSTTLNRQEAANYIGCSVSTLDRYLDAIPHYYASPRVLRFERSALARWKQSGGFATTTPSKRPRVAVVTHAGGVTKVHPDLAWMYAA